MTTETQNKLALGVGSLGLPGCVVIAPCSALFCLEDVMQEIPFGYCHCGCGQITNKVRGDHKKYVYNHHSRRENNPRWAGGDRIIKCPVCGNQFDKGRPSDNRITCSRVCQGQWVWIKSRDKIKARFAVRPNDHFRGRKHSRESKKLISEEKFNGLDTYVKGGNYVMVWAPDHPDAKYGRVPEQRLIAEKVLGRRLIPSEIVHHINGDKSDNCNSNLLICSNSYHHYLHGIMCGLWTFNRHVPERDAITGRFIST